MNVRIEYIQMPVSESMNTKVRRKLDKLVKKFDSIVKAEVTFKQDNDPAGQGKSCAIEVHAPGARLYVRSYSDNFEKSLNESTRDLKRKLRKRKTAMQRHRGVTP
ncbi:HPF/RaiA family ribosome-associated protein [Flavobacteriaceae bacterium F89]|uniref:HPF/RaiA family ribosome-associated protein n=1 Tax=Cerina litoralis TaxID=2874477 RepID=A0AAE3JQW6_9FLAO|nr:HPF/RaiA family ribosome-associated protein [Cerina litoralis]MCG2462329.1 HPF/RaiA family ribosome-associated protein [Cerina litoralis]